MMWFIFALIAALSAASSRTLIKLTSRDREETILFLRYLFAVPFALLMIPLFGIPVIGPWFWPAIIIGCMLDVTVSVMIINAIDHSDMSKSIPFIAFTPMFLLLTGFLILGEVPSYMGITGVMVIVVGAYALKMKMHESGPLEPFRRLFRERWSRYMLVTAFLMAVAGPVFKVAIIESSPAFILAVSFPLCLMFSLSYAFLKKDFQLVPNNSKMLVETFLLGVTLFITSIAFNFAVVDGLVPYVVSIKRLSIFFSVLIGTIWFREKHGLHNIIAGTIMVIGAMLIGIFS